MNIVQITPGAGGMYCGGCFRDNALVAALRQQGHQTLMVPLYLPLTLDEPDQSAGTPIFFGGINVYLDEKFPLFRSAPRWLHDFLSSPFLLNWASGRAAKTRAADVGELALSMIRGEEGNQARELADLIAWLKTQPKPDVICLSNALLVGFARKLKAELGVPIVCLLAGEDTFLDGLPSAFRNAGWQMLSERCVDVDLFLPPSRYYAELMSRRLGLRNGQLRVVPNGINLKGYSGRRSGPEVQGPPVLGYFARMCREKGLDSLVEAYLLLKKRDGSRDLRLHIGGGCGPGDEMFVAEQRSRLELAGVLTDVKFFPNVDHAGKIALFQGLTVFSTPAHYGEAFGLYLIESLAAGVPVVQPRHAAFPELIEATGGGLLCEPGNAVALADAIESLLRDPQRAADLGRTGRQAVEQQFTIERMARDLVSALEQVCASPDVPASVR
jgi:glycosyltransferase involved in cell wall biosynthesis